MLNLKIKSDLKPQILLENMSLSYDIVIKRISKD